MYEVLRESGVIDNKEDNTSTRYLIRQIIVSVPLFFFLNADGFFPFQEKWKNYLKDLCSGYEISAGSIKADILFDGMNDRPWLTFKSSFKLGFRQRIADIGWGMCLSGMQTKLLGGDEKLVQSEIFDIVENCPNNHVYLQLTTNIDNIPPEKLKLQWELLATHIITSKYQAHSLMDLPVSLRLGVRAQDICLDDFGLYSIVTNSNPETLG